MSITRLWLVTQRTLYYSRVSNQMKATKMSSCVIRMSDFIAVQKKILACASDPRGTTITAFSAREVAAFTGLHRDTIYAYLVKHHVPSVKMPTKERKNARVIPMDVFLKLIRQRGNHRVLGKHVNKTWGTLEPTLDFLFDQLFQQK